jgi:hypothetical protein
MWRGLLQYIDGPTACGLVLLEQCLDVVWSHQLCSTYEGMWMWVFVSGDAQRHQYFSPISIFFFYSYIKKGVKYNYIQLIQHRFIFGSLVNMKSFQNVQIFSSVSSVGLYSWLHCSVCRAYHDLSVLWCVLYTWVWSFYLFGLYKPDHKFCISLYRHHYYYICLLVS